MLMRMRTRKQLNAGSCSLNNGLYDGRALERWCIFIYQMSCQHDCRTIRNECGKYSM